MRIILKVIITAAALLLAAYIVPGIAVASLYTALIVAVILGLLNLIIRPILILLTLPITLLTLGLFTLVINAALFWFASTFVRGFTVDGFVPAFIGALIVSAAAWLGGNMLDND